MEERGEKAVGIDQSLEDLVAPPAEHPAEQSAGSDGQGASWGSTAVEHHPDERGAADRMQRDDIVACVRSLRLYGALQTSALSQWFARRRLFDIAGRGPGDADNRHMLGCDTHYLESDEARTGRWKKSPSGLTSALRWTSMHAVRKSIPSGTSAC